MVTLFDINGNTCASGLSIDNAAKLLGATRLHVVFALVTGRIVKNHFIQWS